MLFKRNKEEKKVKEKVCNQTTTLFESPQVIRKVLKLSLKNII